MATDEMIPCGYVTVRTTPSNHPTVLRMSGSAADHAILLGSCHRGEVVLEGEVATTAVVFVPNRLTVHVLVTVATIAVNSCDGGGTVDEVG